MVRELADRIHMLDCRRTVAAEYQPQKQGRCFVYRVIQGTSLSLIMPDDENHLNVRTRMHEYGERTGALPALIRDSRRQADY
jgi:hypothetical protein